MVVWELFLLDVELLNVDVVGLLEVSMVVLMDDVARVGLTKALH